MRCVSSVLLLVLASIAACGGRVDDPAPTSSPGSNSPTSTPASTGCAAACDRVAGCTKPYEPLDACIRDCNLQFPDPARAAIYGKCIDALPCDEIERGLGMNYGPFGVCYSKASGR